MSCVLLACAASIAVADDEGTDWLDEDPLFSAEFEPLVSEVEAPRASRWSASQFATQGGQLLRWRSQIRWEYERAFGQGHYLRVDAKTRRFHSSDTLAEEAGQAYQHNEVEELWWQASGEHCFSKLGRQGVYWGNVENSFALDQLAPFDYTEALLTSFTGLRVAQDMLALQCFKQDWQVELVVNPKPGLSIVSHQQDSLWDQLEDELGAEWGMRLQWSQTDRDISLFWARLEDNLPTPVRVSAPIPFSLQVARFNMLGASIVQGFDRWLLSVDMVWFDQQLQAFSREVREEWEVALGLEYNSPSNHRFNIGIWRYRAQASGFEDTADATALWNLSWRKAYWNDELDLSLLGLWGGEPRIGVLTGLADYAWTQHWSTQLALSYANSDETDLAAALVSTPNGWSLSTNIEWVY